MTVAVGEEIAVRPFRVQVPEADLVDLRQCIAATRWPDRETVPDRSQGARLAELQGAPSLLGLGLRLAEGRDATERLAAVHDDHRRGRRSLLPSPSPR
jgi:hypothetical protein